MISIDIRGIRLFCLTFNAPFLSFSLDGVTNAKTCTYQFVKSDIRLIAAGASVGFLPFYCLLFGFFGTISRAQKRGSGV